MQLTIQISNLKKVNFKKKRISLGKTYTFDILGGRCGVPKPTENRSENDIQDVAHLGTDFAWILLRFGAQVGLENRAKIDLENVWKI